MHIAYAPPVRTYMCTQKKMKPNEPVAQETDVRSYALRGHARLL